MIVLKKDGVVKVWLGERYHELWNEEDEGVEVIEISPKIVLSEDVMNAIVLEYLRGPVGFTGPMGASGEPAPPCSCSK